MNNMKAQVPVEYMTLLTIILVIGVVLFAALYHLTSKTTGKIKNETGVFYLTQESFLINSTGQIQGQLHFNDNVTMNNISITFTVRNKTITVPFNHSDFTTNNGKVFYLSQNGITNYGDLLNTPYLISLIKYQKNNTNYFIDANDSGYFK
jgi:hypothetical protein